MRSINRSVAGLVLAASVFGSTAVSMASAVPANAVQTSTVDAAPQFSARWYYARWYYLGRYYDLRACQNQVEFVTHPSGPYDDAECRDAGDYYELWGVIY